jgi:hypothetical protein
MVKWETLARWGLFGKVGGRSKPGLWSMLAGDGLYILLGIDTGLPSIADRLQYYVDVAYSALWGEDDSLPYDFPVKLYTTLERVLHSRGGMFGKEAAQPNFYCKRDGCASNPLTWTVKVSHAPTADPDKLATFESSIEEALTGAGYDVNVRVMHRPLRLEIDKPSPPTVKLADYWRNIGTLPQDKLWCAAGVTASDKGLVLFARQMTGDSYSAFVSGRSGAGKTQLAMSLVLSLAYANSPAVLSMVILDPKVIDMMVLADLPHLACEVVTRDDDCLAILRRLVGEMEDREDRLRRGDRSFLAHNILVYIDEMADLQAAVAGKEREEMIVSVQRLTQRGRAYGFVIVGATQRAYDVDARMTTKLNDKYALAANNGSDGYAATGVQGVQVHKLPGRGACELWPDGTRLQGFFVANSKDAGYERAIGSFVSDIKGRWLGARPCWVAEANETEPRTMDGFLDSLRADGVTGIHAIRSAHKAYFGTGIGADKAKEIQALLSVP